MAHEPSEENRGLTRATTAPGRSSMMALVLVACCAIALIALLSPRWRDVREEPVGYVGASVAPGPIPSTERRPTQAPQH